MKKKFRLLLLSTFLLTGCRANYASSFLSDSTSAREPKIEEIYSLYQANGGTLTYEEWLTSIKGEKGDAGASILTGKGVPASTLGAEGDSYIDLDTCDVYSKKSGAWTKAGNIKGTVGEVGAKGDQGEKGETGADGKSAYQIWLDAGHTGTEEDFLSWLQASSDTNEQGLEFYIQDDGTYAVSLGTYCLVKKAVIPQTYNGKTVTTFLNSYMASSGNCYVEEIVLPDTITTIGDHAFYGLSKLKTVNIPDGVTYIGDEAFFDCKSLTTINIPNNLTYLGENVFSNCTSLTYNEFEGGNYIGNATNPYLILMKAKNASSVVIHNNCKYIQSDAFSGLTELKTITLLSWLTKIESNMFLGCSSLTSIKIPDGVTTIGDCAFSGCSSLTSITLPDGLTSIGSSAFGYCTSLTSITLPDGLTSIGYGAFENCTSLTSITLPDGLTSIGSSAFGYCTSLTSITLPDGLTSIGYGAFENCTSLTSVVIPDSVTSIGDYLFGWDYKYDDDTGKSSFNIYYAGTSDQWNSISKSSESYFKNFNIYYYSETEPSDTTLLYWHYVNGVATAW